MAGANTSRTLFEGDELPYLVDFRHDLAVGQGVGEITSCTVAPSEGLAVEASVSCGKVRLDLVASAAGDYEIEMRVRYTPGTSGTLARCRFKVLP